jgi:DNA-directed RNA polymerase subunit K/omega
MVVAAPAVPAEDPAIAPFGNRFLLVTVAFRRVMQIRAGSRPRVDVASHQPTVLAVAEVRAGCVPFSAEDAVPADERRS